MIVIPARIGSTRLKDKPLRKIGGVPLITHVCLRALEADIGPVVLCSDDERVLQCAPQGVQQLMCQAPNIHCGSDRVAWALERIGRDHEFIINLQGDLPFIDPQILRDIAEDREESGADIVTAIHIANFVPIELRDPWVWKRCVEPWHIGVYAFTRRSLARFASLPQSENEKLHNLEGARASDNGMRFDWLEVDHMPLEINTESDLKHANEIVEAIWRAEDVRPRYSGVGRDPGWYVHDRVDRRFPSGDDDTGEL